MKLPSVPRQSDRAPSRRLLQVLGMLLLLGDQGFITNDFTTARICLIEINLK